jgi:hypothetical protein
MPPVFNDVPYLYQLVFPMIVPGEKESSVKQFTGMIFPDHREHTILNSSEMKTTTRRRIRRDHGDLPDSADDKKHLQPDEATLDLPDVEDIPGQEHIRPMPPGEMADTTVSSADEEAADLLDTDEDRIMGYSNNNNNVTTEEKELLDQSSQSMAGSDDLKLREAQLDDRDEDGTRLNELTDVSGSDLDVPGSNEDDRDEEIGEEDEENNSYSVPGEKEDQNSGKQ